MFSAMKARLRKLLVLAAALAMFAVCAVLAVSGYVQLSTREYLLTPEEAAGLDRVDCILVLGCGVRPDGSPSLMLQDRLDMGLRLYEMGAAPKLLLSGDHGRKEYDEVNGMKNYVLQTDVPSQDVFLDHAGFSTYESMYRARDVFCADRVIVVSQRYHLYRAVYDARALGLEAWGVAAEDIAYLGQSAREGRELLARCKDVLWCLLQPEPTFLGEAIPVSGDGNLTAG